MLKRSDGGRLWRSATFRSTKQWDTQLNKKGHEGGNRVARAAGNILSPGGDRARLVVFCYHQVLEKHDPLRPGEPDEAQFLNDVELINSVFNVLPFTEAARQLKSGSLPRRSACITFDDGYANNFELAAPILKSVGVPATFFIAGAQWIPGSCGMTWSSNL
mgnify:CR=1 FL=1